jgi:GMP synthase (glutamine-hydrolysing)
MDSLAILDFGSQYAQLIARKLRESRVYCELFPWNAQQAEVQAIRPKGYILSGGPASVYAPRAPFLQAYISESQLPILGICYGMQILAHTLGGHVDSSQEREFGQATIEVIHPNPFLKDGLHSVWMSHGDRIELMPEGFVCLARSDNSPIAAMGDLARNYYGVQFHPEVQHTPDGKEILARFANEICGVKPEWTPDSIIDGSIKRIQDQVGTEKVLVAVSGGVDSSVAAALVHQAVGNQLVAIFAENGLLREGESALVAQAFRKNLGIELVTIDASQQFIVALQGVVDPEIKRRIIGEQFIRVFENQAKWLDNPPFLVQGTIYPDVIESRAPERSNAERIKSHHNVGGLPANMQFQLVEPLRYLFKDEVRAVGLSLGLPYELVWRQPFPGPGLAVRCLGEVTQERLACLREADEILTSELANAGWLTLRPDIDQLQGTSQAFAVLIPIRTVGVMGDQRTYQEVVALRAVTTEDFMTADWARLPYELLAKVASRIVNEVNGVNRVVYDITSKPPATIEWE